MSADTEDFDCHNARRSDRGYGTAAPPIGPPGQPPPAIAPGQIIAACLPQLRSPGQTGWAPESPRRVPGRSLIDPAHPDDQTSLEFPAANDPLIRSLVVAEFDRGAGKSGPAQGGSGKPPSPLIERRRSDRRHIARRQDDGQRSHWRCDDRRAGERRRHARADLAVADVEQPWALGLPARSGDPEAISVFVASQRRDLVAALGSGLASQAGMHLVGVCHAQIRDIRAFVAHASPDLILFDTALLALFGAECLEELREAVVDAKLIVIWDDAHPLAVEAIERHGICGCIPLLASARHYARAIREVSQGGLWLPRWIMSRVCRRILVKEGSPAAGVDAPSSTLPALTAREQAIARRAAAGKTNKEIAIELNVSPDTVKKHLGAVFDKVGVHRRSQLAYCLAVPGQRRPE